MLEQRYIAKCVCEGNFPSRCCISSAKIAYNVYFANVIISLYLLSLEFILTYSLFLYVHWSLAHAYYARQIGQIFGVELIELVYIYFDNPEIFTIQVLY